MSRPVRICCMVAIAVLSLLALDTVAWWALTTRLASEATAWQQARIADGYAVTAGIPSRAGWPFRAALILPGVGIATGTPGSPNTVAWRTGEVRLVYAPWHPAEVIVALDGAQTLQLGAAPAITLQVNTLDLVIPLNEAGQADGIVAKARNLQVPLQAGTVAVDAVWLKLAPADLHLSLSALTLPGAALPLGVTIGSLDLDAHSTVPLPEQRDPAVAAAAWRDAGGKLVISDAALGWGPLDIRGTGTFGLDSSLQPTGSGALRITGYAQAIDALARSGIVNRNNARVASTLLSLVSHPGSDGVPQAELPFTLQGGLLSTGAIPLLKLPPLALP